MNDKHHELFGIDQKYRERAARIQASEDLTPDAKARKIREAGKEYGEARAEAEGRIAKRLEAEGEAAYRRAYGPGLRTRTAEEETARELRLARIRAELTDEFEAGRQDPLRAYETAIRSGDEERAEVIGKVGTRFLQGAARRQRLADLVEQNLPEDRRRAKQKIAELERQKMQLDFGSALMRRARGR